MASFFLPSLLIFLTALSSIESTFADVMPNADPITSSQTFHKTSNRVLPTIEPDPEPPDESFHTNVMTSDMPIIGVHAFSKTSNHVFPTSEPDPEPPPDESLHANVMTSEVPTIGVDAFHKASNHVSKPVPVTYHPFPTTIPLPQTSNHDFPTPPSPSHAFLSSRKIKFGV